MGALVDEFVYLFVSSELSSTTNVRLMLVLPELRSGARTPFVPQ